ncbi:hypothetical protein J5277_14870 [Rhizobium sp. 16-449-1b]|uniref:hypothetical protein n=1 Tax=Rhizobium sp. 16-449-1b TaxID=2819989 RepID=UPI001ADA3A48|nr:hypothetical protein [Rhizobium sp. 16-449-1b]
MSANSDVETYFDLVADLQRKDRDLSPLQAGILAAADLDIATDSRTFSRMLGIAHALVLRELNALEERAVGLRVTKRDARTMRTFFVLDERT